MRGVVIEVLTFRLASGVSDDAFLEIDERVRTNVLYTRPGLIRATTARSDDGEWVVVLLWGSAADADAAKEAVAELVEQMSDATRRRYTTFD
jgi:hypothetical protein